jgi:hypothetical protein
MREEQQAKELALVGAVVDVHVDETGQHEGPRIAGGLRIAARGELGDARTAHKDAPARLTPKPGIDDRDVRQLEAAVRHVHRRRSEPGYGHRAEQTDGDERDGQPPSESAHECAQPPPAPRAHPRPLSHTRNPRSITAGRVLRRSDPSP